MMVESSSTILSETPCVDPHAGCCGDLKLGTKMTDCNFAQVWQSAAIDIPKLLADTKATKDFA